MIYDTIENLIYYNRDLSKAIEFLSTCTIDMPIGRYDINGDQMYANVEEYETQPVTNKKIESHLIYTDIQVGLSGQEQIELYYVPDLIVKSRNTELDLLFYEETNQMNTTVILKPGMAAVLFPHDAHRPGVHPPSGLNTVKKVVVKVALQPWQQA